MNRILLLGTAGAIALVIGGKMALNQQSPSNSALAYGENSSPPVQANAILQLGTSRVASPSPAPVPPVPEQPTYYSQQITTCARSESNANFRQYPTLDPTSVLGVVAYGDSVQLTGRTVRADGVVWYEAIAPDLYPSPDVGAQNQLKAGQIGWIASCFVGG
ncbi:MAG: SH3 domain-containing protein [Leptolyngbyaceae cyanobacterium bins.302]|nr:SH3 domain-containing protein [Leptolyngbyaceae cyanobacterium bins.302]